MRPARIVMQRCGWAGVRPVLRGGETGKGPHLAYPDDPYGTLTQEEMIDQLRQRAAELERKIIWPVITRA